MAVKRQRLESTERKSDAVLTLLSPAHTTVSSSGDRVCRSPLPATHPQGLVARKTTNRINLLQDKFNPTYCKWAGRRLAHIYPTFSAKTISCPNFLQRLIQVRLTVTWKVILSLSISLNGWTFHDQLMPQDLGKLTPCSRQMLPKRACCLSLTA